MATDLGKVGMRMRGTWDSSTAYEVLDAVSYNNGLYVAKQAVPAGTLPTNTTYWQVAVNPAALNDYFVPTQSVNISGNVPTAEEMASVPWIAGPQSVAFLSSGYVRSMFIGTIMSSSTGAGLLISYYGDKLYFARMGSGTWTITSMNIP